MSSLKYTILISSTASRSGYHLTHYFLEKKCRVFALYHSNITRLEKLKKLFPTSLYLSQVDLTCQTSIANMIHFVSQHTDSITSAIHTYGPYLEKPLQETSYHEWRHIFTANLDSAFLFSQACYTLLQKKAPSHLFFFSYSNAEHIGSSLCPAYHISKNAILQLTKQLAVEWGNQQIAVNAIAPGVLADSITKTTLDPSRIIPQQRFGTIHDFSDFMFHLISSKNIYITGNHFLASGGYSL